MKLPSKLPQTSVKLPGLKLSGRGGADVVGLDIQPGFVAAVQARVNGSLVAERVATMPLPADTMRDGEVRDDAALAEALRELFASSGLSKRVRIGVANQRTVLRTLELPPVTDRSELTAAVNFVAQEQVPMPLNNAVLDFHPLGVVDTPEGPRQRVVLVAAQRDMIERLLGAVRAAGLTPAGVDLSAFALIRSLYSHDTGQDGRVLYLNVDGLTNLAIAEGTVCRFTRVVGGGLEAMASELASRRGIPLDEARTLIAAVDLTVPPLAAEPAPVHDEPAPGSDERAAETAHDLAEELSGDDREVSVHDDQVAPTPGADHEPASGDADPRDDSDEAYDYAYESGQAVAAEQPAAVEVPDADVWAVLDNGVREISGEVRNSLDFHRSQEGGGDVSHIVLSGAAAEIPGFAEALEVALRVEVRGESIAVADGARAKGVRQHRLAVATGLATSEVSQ